MSKKPKGGKDDRRFLGLVRNKRRATGEPAAPYKPSCKYCQDWGCIRCR